MSDEDKNVGMMTPDRSIDPMQVIEAMKYRTGTMLAAAIEEGALLDVNIEGLQLEVRGLRASLREVSRTAQTAHEMLHRELEASDVIRSLLARAYAMINVKMRSEASEATLTLLDEIEACCPGFTAEQLPDESENDDIIFARLDGEPL